MAPANVVDIFSFSNPAYNSYVFYSAVLCLKILIMAFLTAKQRISKKVYANPEDASMSKGKVKVDEDVERVRRAHLNDLENIPVFLFLFALYLLTNPSTFIAVMLLRIFTAARIAHTLVYAVVVIPQPARAIAFGIGQLINVYIGVQVVLSFASAL